MNDIYNNSVLALKFLSDTATNNKAAENLTLEALLAPLEAAKQQQKMTQVSVLGALADESLGKYAPLAREPYETERLQKIQEILQKLRSERQKTFALVNSGNQQGAYLYYATHAAPYMDELNTLIIELSNFNAQKAEATLARDNINFVRAEKILFAVPIIAALLALSPGFLVAQLFCIFPVQTPQSIL